MAKSKYSYKKRQKELARKEKQARKQQRRLEKKIAREDGNETEDAKPEIEPPDDQL